MIPPLWASVPPKTYGGIERHVSLLADELVRRGHEVVLFATGDSRTGATLHAITPTGVAEIMDRGHAYFYEHYLNTAIAEALQGSEGFDLLHFHVGCPAMPLCLLSRAPVLHSLHTGLTLDDQWILDRFPEAAVTALSCSQIAPIEPERRRTISIVPYGFDFRGCVPAPGPAEYLLFLGRIAPHKAPDDAIRIARAAGRPIVLAGAPVTAEDRAFFAREIEPLLSGADVTYVGAVNEEQKRRLFDRAIALVFPIRWDEPFGLVMLEAMAHGVPVLACARGSVPEVVDHGTTGFCSTSPGELASLVDAAARLDRASVRKHAAQRFSHERMVDRYLALYDSLRRPHSTQVLP